MARAVASFAAARAGSVEAGRDRQAAFEDGKIWAAAHHGERVFHGKPSGVDTGLALWGRLSLFTPQAPDLPIVSFLAGTGISLVYGTVPREASCAANVSAIGKAMAAGNAEVSAILAELGTVSRQAADLLGNASPAADGLGKLADTAMNLLRKLGLSTPALDALVAAGLAAGATGGKLSGGGAGGAFWLACPDSQAATRIQTAVIEEARRLDLPGYAFTGVTSI
jgi:mevalonate kinase